jgi:hypothetical protein
MLVTSRSNIAVFAALTFLSAGLLAATTHAAEPTPSYNTKIPENIMTPDKVETRIGTLEFFDGIPTKKTAALLYDNLDFLRGVETFLNGVPATSLEGMRRGMVRLGLTKSNQALIFDQRMDSNPLFLTGNTSTVYCSIILDLKKDGPTVVEVPPGSGPGTVNDAYFRFVIDMGPPGPDRGKGGKYLILPPGYEGDVPEGYFTAKSTSWVNWLILRGFLVDGKPDFSSNLYKTGLKVYPLAKAADPPKMEFLNGSKKPFNTIHANTYEFYEELHTVIDREPIGMLDPELRGLFASIGIQKGKPFAPDARMKKILTDAVAVANGTARALLWYQRDKSEFFHENTYWKKGFIGNSYEYLRDEGMGGRHLDARTHFYYNATVNTPAMAMKLVEKGSKYAWGYLDSNGNYLDGGKTYRMHIPKDPPVKKFTSIVVYDPQTRSELQTGQPYPSKSSATDKDTLVYNKDGSYTLYFGPKAPAGKEANWIQTVEGKGWFCLLRLYSPTEAWYEGKWLPSEIELVQ